MFLHKNRLVPLTEALPGREQGVVDPTTLHTVLGVPLNSVPDGAQVAYFAAGCFWGVEKLFWNVPGVIVTAAGYQGGHTPNPTYDEVCSGRTAHAESVRVVYDPAKVSYDDLLRVFFENHDPTQGMRQGNDRGTQYRSAIWTTTPAQLTAARATLARMQANLTAADYGAITTEIGEAGPFYYAERYHQQYLDKNPSGYCPVHATGVKCG